MNSRMASSRAACFTSSMFLKRVKIGLAEVPILEPRSRAVSADTPPSLII